MMRDNGPDPQELARIEGAKAASMAQLLFKCARLFNEEALERVRRETGFDGLRVAHTSLMPHIDFHGTRLTVLASRLGISKQAVGQLVDEMEGMGALERVPDPDDGRAKLIRFSARGREWMMQGLGLLVELEREYAELIGPAQMEALRPALAALLEALEARAQGAQGSD